MMSEELRGNSSWRVAGDMKFVRKQFGREGREIGWYGRRGQSGYEGKETLWEVVGSSIYMWSHGGGADVVV